MFSFLKAKPESQRNRLFRITLHVARGTNLDMPANLLGAYVPVFVGAADHESAARDAVSSLSKQGFEVLAIADGKIYELDASRWDAFVAEAWPEFVAWFPRQHEVLEKLDAGLLFTGPFASYDSPDDV
jgi:hypothetical protein